MKPAPDWELVYKRNPVERIKRDRSPLGILDELPALIAAGYERVDEEDIVRLKWWGLYHDKPKIGTFMLRIKLPGGRVSPEGLRAIGEISNEFGRGDGELSTRQNVQLHWLELGSLPAVFDRLHAAGPHLRGRVRRRRPQHHRLPGRRPRRRRALRHPADRRRGGRVLLRQPRLLEPAAQAQDHGRRLRAPLQRAGDQLHLARRRGARRGRGLRRPGGRRALVGAADRARPRRLRPEGGDGRGAARAARRVAGGHPLPDLAREGADEVHGRRLRAGRDPRRASSGGSGGSWPTSRSPMPDTLGDHIGVHAQKQPGLVVHRRSRPSRPRLRRPDGRARATWQSASAATSA